MQHRAGVVEMGLGTMRRDLMVWRGAGLAWRALFECVPRIWDADGGGVVGGVFGVVMGFLIVREITRNGWKLLKIKGRGGF